MKNSHPVYLHFLDRELVETCKASFSSEKLLKLIILSVLCSDDFAYFAFSHLFELLSDYEEVQGFVLKLCEIGLLVPVSSHSTFEDFLDTRQKLYVHDKERYPQYFNAQKKLQIQDWRVLEGSTTSFIHNKFLSRLIYPAQLGDYERHIYERLAVDTLSQSFEEGKAVTKKIFDIDKERLVFQKDFESTQLSLARTISMVYTDRYLEVFDGTIISGIQHLMYYDVLAKEPWKTHFPSAIAVFDICKVPFSDFISMMKLVEIKLQTQYYQLFCQYFFSAMEKLYCIYNKDLATFFRVIYKMKELPMDIADDYCAIIQNIQMLDKKLLEEGYMGISIKNEESNDKGTIVVLVATDDELKECCNVFTNNNHKSKIEKESQITFLDVYGFDRRVIIALSQMGSLGPGSSIILTNDIIDTFSPEYILMGGICFGAKEDKEKIGDVIAPARVWAYEPQKILESAKSFRGEIIPVSPDILQTIRFLAQEFESFNLHEGLFASGEKLVNSKVAIDALIQEHDDCSGGDMESAGLASVCTAKGIKFAVIKGISDWGYRKDDIHHSQAAFNSFSLIYKLIKFLSENS